MRRNLYLSLALSLSLSLLLGGCAIKPGTTSGPHQPFPPVEDAAVGGPSAAAQALSTAEIQRVLMLLDRAEQAMKARRYTSPGGANAWEDYRDVLALLPAHEEALAGVRKIADSYIDWGYAALRQGQYESARSYQGRAAMVMPEHPALGGLKAAIPARETGPELAMTVREAPAPQPEPVAKAPPPSPVRPAEVPVTAAIMPEAGQSEFSIDRRQLRQRSGELQAQLAGYADLIEARNSRVTIEAPSDADGRWLYQRLNDRREEYRIRANFRLNPQPRIRLLD